MLCGCVDQWTAVVARWWCTLGVGKCIVCTVVVIPWATFNRLGANKEPAKQRQYCCTAAVEVVSSWWSVQTWSSRAGGYSTSWISWYQDHWKYCSLHTFVTRSPPPIPSLGHMWDVLLVCGRRGILKKNLSLFYSIVYYDNGAQRYEQFLQVGRLCRALILLGLVLCLPSTSVSWIFTVSI